MIKFKPAPTYYRLLNGIISVFKPEGECTFKIVEKLQGKLSSDLNSMLCYNFDRDRADEKFLGSSLSINGFIDVTGLRKKSTPLTTESTTLPNLSGLTSHTPPLNTGQQSLSVSPLNLNAPLLTRGQVTGVSNSENTVQQTDNALKLIYGQRYLSSDFKISYLDNLSKHSSGVLLLSIGNLGRQSLEMIGESKLLRVYHVKGRLGYCTQNFSPKGKFIERASFRHVSQAKIDKICAMAQAAFSREMYRYSGISPDSQDAYELAAAGIIRPAERRTPPIVYGVKCIDFQPPDFTLEIHSINERCNFLNKLIHDMAVQLKSRAVCTGVRRLRYGYFDVDRTLVRSQWNLENIIKNIEENQNVIMSEMVD